MVLHLSFSSEKSVLRMRPLLETYTGLQKAGASELTHHSVVPLLWLSSHTEAREAERIQGSIPLYRQLQEVAGLQTRSGKLDRERPDLSCLITCFEKGWGCPVIWLWVPSSF